MAIARAFMGDEFTHKGFRKLAHYRGALQLWTGTHYQPLTDDALRARAYTFLESALKPAGNLLVPFAPARRIVGDVLDALRAVAFLDDQIEPPSWLDDHRKPARNLIATASGLLDISTRELHPHTPAFFTFNAVDFAYDADAPEPTAWLQFLAQLWPTDVDARNTLQEIFGLALTHNTGHQKAFLIVGPKRSGKGTIARVLTALVGRDNVCAPTLASMSNNFGLSPLIGKQLAIVGDARLGARADQSSIAERLLSITGEDAQTIDRKFLRAWTGRLSTRFVIISNELPRLSDASAALPSRFILLTLTESFFGCEDHGLLDRLLSELPSILNWSLAGLDRLTRRGSFVQPASAAEAIAALEDLASPVGAFVRERCIIGPAADCEVGTLFEAWRDWCAVQGRDQPGTAATFGRDLRAVIPSLRTANRRAGAGRERWYQGAALL